ncbi:MAG TPA: hypothetical protein EYH45_02040 [Candidatus Caldiarchaeum subterraneum]|uniref:Uncharacterized protein n=1 Tax=Caldiarchaeum subterraneum TaxID=311458 RepID=A0A832ZXV7_CALS0|nr:hypothetical protein [Aigarchaeota archaeon]HIQ29326.1 hypothetical protein [Candidatus Caldarchaeum subterraneum]
MTTLGTIAVAWLVALSLIPTILLVTSMIALVSSASGIALEKITEETRDRSIKVTAVEPLTNKTFKIRMLNEGERKYRVKDMIYADLILVYYLEGSNVKRVAWLHYDPSGLLSEGWRIDSMVNDVVDPVNSTSGMSGFWNPGEEMHVIAWVSKAANTSLPAYVSFTPPPMHGGG